MAARTLTASLHPALLPPNALPLCCPVVPTIRLARLAGREIPRRCLPFPVGLLSVSPSPSRSQTKLLSDSRRRKAAQRLPTPNRQSCSTACSIPDPARGQEQTVSSFPLFSSPPARQTALSERERSAAKDCAGCSNNHRTTAAPATAAAAPPGRPRSSRTATHRAPRRKGQKRPVVQQSPVAPRPSLFSLCS